VIVHRSVSVVSVGRPVAGRLLRPATGLVRLPAAAAVSAVVVAVVIAPAAVVVTTARAPPELIADSCHVSVLHFRGSRFRAALIQKLHPIRFVGGRSGSFTANAYRWLGTLIAEASAENSAIALSSPGIGVG